MLYMQDHSLPQLVSVFSAFQRDIVKVIRNVYEMSIMMKQNITTCHLKNKVGLRCAKRTLDVAA